LSISEALSECRRRDDAPTRRLNTHARVCSAVALLLSCAEKSYAPLSPRKLRKQRAPVKNLEVKINARFTACINFLFVLEIFQRRKIAKLVTLFFNARVSLQDPFYDVHEDLLHKSNAEKDIKLCPEMEASFMSRMFFEWFTKSVVCFRE